MLTYDFGYGKAKPNGRISKRHNSCYDREPRELMEVWYLA